MLKIHFSYLKTLLVSLGVLGFLILSPALTRAAACDPSTIAGSIACGDSQSSGVPAPQDATSNVKSTVQNVINILSVIAGVVAVIMIIYAGLRFVTGSGVQENVTNAKNTVLYAVIGLVIVGVAQIAVHFVVGNVKQATNCTSTSSQTSC